MGKKSITLFTLIAFIVFSISCLTTSYETQYETRKFSTTPDNLESKIVTAQGVTTKIIGVQIASGEYIELSEDLPVEVYQDIIKGYRTKMEVIDLANVVKVIRKNGRIYEIETRDGKRYGVYSLVDGYKYRCSEPISIPISEVELVWIEIFTTETQEMSSIKTLGLVGPLIAVALIAMLVSQKRQKSSQGSCPYIYSYDGEKYMFDAEPYGGAICRGLKRTEWCGLENIKEVNGKYKIMATNELDETQFTDEVKLLVVDHPEGVKVVPDISGGIHTFSQPIIPILAYDNRGKDLMPFISKNDKVFWLSQDDGKNPEKKEDLRDELIFEFPKPKEAKKAKLLINAFNTLWGSQSLKQYLDLYGDKVNEWYDEINSLGPAYFKMVNMHVRAELYSLQVRVETDDGWKSKGLIIGGGPFVSEDKVYSFDISDVPGDVLKVKLTPPAAFWMINYLAVDYSEDLPVQVTEIEAIEAIDHKGQDVRGILKSNDNNYLSMPNIGDRADLVFESPPHSNGMERTVILKASGYYDIHLEGKGDPQLQLIDKLHSEPGYAVQYAFKEYLKWKKEIMAKISRGSNHE
jgi:hypothetical protein